MKTSKPVLLSVLLALFLSGSEGFCTWTLNTDFLLTLPNAFVDQQVDEIFKNSASLDFPVANQVVNAGYQVSLSGINVKVSYPSTVISTISSGESWQLASNQVSAQITIGQINASQTIHEVVNGVNLNLALNAACTNIVLNLPAGGASILAVASLGVQPTGVVTTLNQFTMQWAASAWQIAPFTCTGAVGFEQLVNTEITQLLGAPTTFQPAVEQYLQNAIDQTITAGLSQLFKGLKIDTQRTDILATVTAQALSSTGTGYRVGGVLSVQLPESMPGQNVQVSTAPLPSTVTALNSAEAYLTLPEGMIASLLARVQDTSLLSIPFTSNNIQAVVVSWSATQIVALAPTMMVAKAAVGVPVDATLTDTMKTVDSFLLGQISGDLKGVMNAPVKGNYIPFVDLNLPISAEFNVAVKAGSVSCTLSKVSTNLGMSYDPSYVKLYSPDGWIDKSAFNSGIQSFLGAGPLSFRLPVFNIQNLFQLQAAGLEHHPDTQTINLYLNNP